MSINVTRLIYDLASRVITLGVGVVVVWSRQRRALGVGVKLLAALFAPTNMSEHDDERTVGGEPTFNNVLLVPFPLSSHFMTAFTRPAFELLRVFNKFN